MKLKNILTPTTCCGFLLFLLCLALPFTSLAAEKSYQVTEKELTQLEMNLNRLQTIAEDSKIESKLQKEQLAILKHQLSESDSLLMKQEVSLKNANILLMRYEDEQKKEKQKMKRERMAWITTVGALLVYQLRT